jgi:hypothetical protein
MKQDEILLKTKSEGLKKLLIITLNCFGQNLTNFCPFFKARMKVSQIQPVFDEVLQN